MRIQSNGLGVQSTTVFLMAHYGDIETIDHSIFSDTQEEPEAVYEHLDWLRTVSAPCPIIHICTAGKLGDHLLAVTIGSSQRKKHKPGKDGSTRFASIPAFTATHHEVRQPGKFRDGIVRRQCTKEYKVEPVERVIRRTILGLKPRQRVPKGVEVEHIFGISLDERCRADRIMDRIGDSKWQFPVFPLIEKRMTRDDCRDYLKGKVPHEVPRTACVFCPFKSDEEWHRTKQSPKDWARAVEVDRGLRVEGLRVNEGMNQALYVHRRCIPLEMIDFDAIMATKDRNTTPSMFANRDCEGMCGV